MNSIINRGGGASGASGALRLPTFENVVCFWSSNSKKSGFYGYFESYFIQKKTLRPPLLLKLGDIRGSNSATPPCLTLVEHLVGRILTKILGTDK